MRRRTLTGHDAKPLGCDTVPGCGGPFLFVRRTVFSKPALVAASRTLMTAAYDARRLPLAHHEGGKQNAEKMQTMARNLLGSNQCGGLTDRKLRSRNPAFAPALAFPPGVFSVPQVAFAGVPLVVAFLVVARSTAPGWTSENRSTVRADRCWFVWRRSDSFAPIFAPSTARQSVFSHLSRQVHFLLRLGYQPWKSDPNRCAGSRRRRHRTLLLAWATGDHCSAFAGAFVGRCPPATEQMYPGH
jgi:hypothetical protein